MRGTRTELDVLNLILNDQRASNGTKSSLLQMQSQFKFRGYQCFVFDLLGNNLYQELKGGRFSQPDSMKTI